MSSILTLADIQNRLRLSASEGNLDSVTELVEHINIYFSREKTSLLDAVNEYGYTALHLAVCNHHLEVVDFLLSQGANPNISNPSNWTPLHSAAQEGYLEITTRLIADPRTTVDAKNEFEETPLYYAQYEGHTEVEKCISEFSRWSSLRSAWCTAVALGRRVQEKKEKQQEKPQNKRTKRLRLRGGAEGP